MSDIVEVKDTAPAVSNTFDLVDVDSAKAFMDNYQEVCKALLDTSDYQKVKIKGKTRAFKKKSAWRKIATAFNISDDVVEKEIIRDENHQIISATFQVIATAPNGRSGVASASCSIFDKIKATDTEQPSNFELRKRFNNAENDVIATAHTRAKSRAISDLVGMGELSAEEMEDMNIIEKQPKMKPKASPKVKPKTTAKKVVKPKVKPKKVEPNVIDTAAVEVEVISDKPALSIKDKMELDNSIKMAVNELREESRIVNSNTVKDLLLTKMEKGVLSKEAYDKAMELME